MKWIRTFFRQWLWELLQHPFDGENWRDHFQRTCFKCMHYGSQHILYPSGLVRCAADKNAYGDGCNCLRQSRARKESK